MLRIKDDRLDYGKLLAPPAGFELEMAAGTTYSLDLEALTFAAMSMGFAEDADSLIKENEVYLLAALRKVASRTVLFHEAGHILVSASKRNNRLFPLLEKMVVPVALDSNGNYPAFHPKMWLLAFKKKDGGEMCYRFIVLSRNLTFDRSWDIAVALEGSERKEDEQLDNKSKPICNLLKFLKGKTKNSNHKNIIDNLIQKVKQVNFRVLPPAEDFEILPLGIGENACKINEDIWLGEKVSKGFNELVIVSPFLSKDIIERFCKRRVLKNNRRTLITRRSSLSELEADCMKPDKGFEVFCLKDSVVDGEDFISDDNLLKQKQDIHAKIFSVTKWNATWLYMGSMNATNAAFNRNVELDIMLKLNGKYNSSALMSELLAPGEGSPECLFEKIDALPQNSVDSGSKDKLTKLLKDFCRAGVTATVANGSNAGLYTVTVSISNYNDEFKVISLNPITVENISVEVCSGSLCFYNIELKNLTEFYRVSISDGEGNNLSRIVKIPTAVIPGDRDSAIYSEIINSPSKLYEYAAFLLSNNKLQSLIDASSASSRKGSGSGKAVLHTAIYESMLEAAVRNGEELKEIEEMIKMIPDSNGAKTALSSLMNSFKKFLK